MKSKRMAVDAAMIVLLPCLMAYSLIGELFHEVAGAVSLYGVYAFVHRQFPAYMTLRSRFVFFDYSEPRPLFFADYLAIMVLFAMIGCVVGRALKRRSYDRSGTDQNSL